MSPSVLTVHTLWDVNDASTSRLMSDFYARWVKDPTDGKAEALRQAQLALLRGPAVASENAGKSAGRRSSRKRNRLRMQPDTHIRFTGRRLF